MFITKKVNHMMLICSYPIIPTLQPGNGHFEKLLIFRFPNQPLLPLLNKKKLLVTIHELTKDCHSDPPVGGEESRSFGFQPQDDIVLLNLERLPPFILTNREKYSMIRKDENTKTNARSSEYSLSLHYFCFCSERCYCDDSALDITSQSITPLFY